MCMCVCAHCCCVPAEWLTVVYSSAAPPFSLTLVLLLSQAVLPCACSLLPRRRTATGANNDTVFGAAVKLQPEFLLDECSLDPLSTPHLSLAPSICRCSITTNDAQQEFRRFHADCMRGHQALVIRINEAQELFLGPVESVQGGWAGCARILLTLLFPASTPVLHSFSPDTHTLSTCHR